MSEYTDPQRAARLAALQERRARSAPRPATDHEGRWTPPVGTAVAVQRWRRTWRSRVVATVAATAGVAAGAAVIARAEHPSTGVASGASATTQDGFGASSGATSQLAPFDRTPTAPDGGSQGDDGSGSADQFSGTDQFGGNQFGDQFGSTDQFGGNGGGFFGGGGASSSSHGS